ncbi:MAG: hypothetical protein V1835_02075 [Candidatus Micrarchaeota archaeon]
MTVLHHHADPIQMVSILFALLLITSRGFALDLPAADAVSDFFSYPWPIIAFSMVMLAPVVFFRYFPGSMVFFISGLILFLALRAGLN